jgi:hypothetical protein
MAEIEVLQPLDRQAFNKLMKTLDDLEASIASSGASTKDLKLAIDMVEAIQELRMADGT